MSVLERLFGRPTRPAASVSPSNSVTGSLSPASALAPRLAADDAEDKKDDKKDEDKKDESNAVDGDREEPRDDDDEKKNEAGEGGDGGDTGGGEDKKDDDEDEDKKDDDTTNADGDGSSDQDDKDSTKDKESNMAVSTAPVKASAAQIEKAFGSDPKFCFDCIKAELSMEAAYEKWTAKLNAQIADQGKQVQGAAKLGNAGAAGVTQPLSPSMRTSGGADTPGAGGAGGAVLFGDEAQCTSYEQLVDCIKQRHMRTGVREAMALSNAHSEAARKAPAMHEEWKDREMARYDEAKRARLDNAKKKR